MRTLCLITVFSVAVGVIIVVTVLVHTQGGANYSRSLTTVPAAAKEEMPSDAIAEPVGGGGLSLAGGGAIRLLAASGRNVDANVSSVESSDWAPAVLTECLQNMAHNWAPCIAASNDKIEYAEELIFPDFSVSFPILLSDNLSFLEKKLMKEHSEFDQTHVYFRGQHGQNLVITDGSYVNAPPVDRWSQSSCMSPGVQHKPLLTDGGYFAHHFLDRVTHVIEQAAHLLMPRPLSLHQAAHRVAL